MIEDEQKMTSKKAKKMRKHFDVLINGQKAKILNFRFKPYEDEYESGEILELVSKVKLPLSPGDLASFEMTKDNNEFLIKGQFKSASISPGIYIWTFIIYEKTERPTARIITEAANKAAADELR